VPGLFFSVKNNQGESVFDIAAAHGNLESIPDSIRIWDPQCLLDKVIEWCNQEGQGLIPTELLDPDLWALPIPTGVSHRTTALHIVAERRFLHHLPLSLTGQGAMLLENSMGETPLSVVIARGDLKLNLERISPDFGWDMHAGLPGYPTYYHLLSEHRQIGLLDQIPEQSYFLKDRTGKTVLDLLFKSGEIEVAPEHVRWHQRDYREKKSKELLSAGRLDDLPRDFGWVDEMSDGMTPLHYAASEGLLHFLPVEFLSENNLTTKDRNGRNVATTAFESGNIQEIPEDLRHLAKGYAESLLLKAIEGGSLADLPSWVKSPEYLLRKCTHLVAKTYLETYLHRIAATGLLGQIPPNCIQPIHLKERDWDRNTVLHTLVTSGYADTAPALWFSEPEVLGVKNADGASVYELAAVMPMLGSVPVSIFSKEVLLTSFGNGKNLADLIEEHGNTPLLPPELRNFSKARAVTRLKECFSMDFVSAATLHSSEFSELLTLEQFQLMRLEFVREWFARHPDLSLDEEQADAVAECNSHIQVTARAGSGKTRTLVARAMFQIQHCRIPASNLLILAFNKKAVEEIRERLSKVLSEEQMPHVLTFHALAYRIVRPTEDLIFDEGETKESQVFSTTIQRIIDEELRNGPFEVKLRELMEARWNADLKRIIELGFNLPQEEFLEHRVNLPRTTMNGRRVDTEAHKHIGNALLRLGIAYSYRRGIHRYAGEAYAPDFSHYNRATEHRLLIEVLGEKGVQANAARQAFWNSDRSANAHLLQFTEADCLDPDVTLERVTRELANCGLSVSPISDDELWLVLRDDVIRDFTKAVKNFISRCQKELISPDRLDGMLPDSDPELWTSIIIGLKLIAVPNVPGLQVRFWRLCSEIYRRYQQVLTESHQTDFDQLMLDSAVMIREGRTGFKSERGSGDICQIRHFLIDEFQDFSHLFDELRKSIVAQSPAANFFCVGDDWQAINKFAGSDLRYFTGFTQTFEPSVRKLITRNYRSCRKIVGIGNQVMQGEGEPSVPNSNEEGNTWRVEVGGYGNLSEAEEIVIEELGDDALSILRIASDCTSRGESVAILSRTSSVVTPEGMHKLEKWQEKLRSFLPEKDCGLLEVSTTHGYKGKEADVVILLDPESYPFVHPDSIFNTIFGDTFHSIQDDEKRLFYVGVTRPKKTLYLLSYPSRYSDERPYKIKFLANAYPPSFDINRIQSNLLCGSRVVVRLTTRSGIYGNGGTFPIKDQLKALEFKWNEDRKIWSIFLERGSINSPFECVQYLNAQPWIRNADGIVASFAWEDQKHRFRIERGQAIPDTAAASEPEPVIIGGQWQPIDRGVAQPTLQAMPPSSSMVSASHNIPVEFNDWFFETNVAGMKYSGRMERAKHLVAGNPLKLVREPENSYDSNAIKVLTSQGEQIGYLSKQVAGYLAKTLDKMGVSHDAKVSSVWKQPIPHFFVRIEVCFRLPVGINIPSDLGRSYSVKPASIAQPKTVTDPPTAGLSQTAVTTPTPAASQMVSGSLTPAQDSELALIGDSRLRPLITELYLSGACPWPVIGYEGRDSTHHCTDSMLEVAWPDQKIGIYLPTNIVTTFAANGWVILPAAAVTLDMLRSVLSSASPSPSEPPRVEPQVDLPVVSTPQTGSCDLTDPVNLEALSQKQRADLENLLEPHLAPIIAEMYLAGCSDWPEIGYEGRDSDGRCTGSMLEVAWLDFKIGIAVPMNDFRSFSEAGWAIVPAATVTASELRNLFVARTESTTPTGAILPIQAIETKLEAFEKPSNREFTDTNIHIRNGQFYDEEPDDDLPF
jgi:DNA helicase-4